MILGPTSGYGIDRGLITIMVVHGAATLRDLFGVWRGAGLAAGRQRAGGGLAVAIVLLATALVACYAALAKFPAQRPWLNPARVTLLLPQPDLIAAIHYFERKPGEDLPDRTAENFAALPWSPNLLDARAIRRGAVSWTVPAGSAEVHGYYVRSLMRDGRDCIRLVLAGQGASTTVDLDYLTWICWPSRP